MSRLSEKIEKRIEEIKQDLQKEIHVYDPDDGDLGLGFDDGVTVSCAFYNPFVAELWQEILELRGALKSVDENVVNIENHSQYTKDEDQRTLRRNAMWARKLIRETLTASIERFGEPKKESK